MDPAFALFVSMLTTLLAVINPLEAIPVYLKLMQDKSEQEHRQTARKSCLYVFFLVLFFLVFGNILLRIFGVPLSVVRVVGGIILMKIGFKLFAPSANSTLIPTDATGSKDVSFIPLAMPIMFGPGAIATAIGLTSTIRDSAHFVLSFGAGILAIAATMFITYLALIYAKDILSRIGPQGIDAATRIVGFFVSAMGVGLIFHGIVEFLQSYGVLLNSAPGQ